MGLFMHGIRLGVLFIVLVIAVIRVLPADAWFYMGRKLAVVGKIEAPVSIHIGGGNKESVIYMDLIGLDLKQDGTSDGSGSRYKDYVFCVYGEELHKFMIQLAYTTNNQFEYEVYPAVFSSDGTVPGGNTRVDYLTHPESGAAVAQVYYFNPSSAITMTKLNNKTVGTEELGKLSGDTGEGGQYRRTYGDYTYVNKYAMPIYMRSGTIEREGISEGNGQYLYYFVLRVKWSEDAVNTKESDMIYISAQVVS